MARKKIPRSKRRRRRKRSPVEPTVSLCMIVKNEESNLADCLESVRAAVDEIIIVDTGSTDGTIAVARTFTDKVFVHPWEHDFSKSRNHSIGYATGNWILQLDADERFAPGDGAKIKPFLRGLPQETGHVFLPIINYSDTGGVTSEFPFPRLFRNGIGIRYAGRVHNQVLVRGAPTHLPLPIHHYGYALSPERLAAKFERTVTLLKEQIEQEPQNPFHYHNLCLSYSMARRDREAIHWGERAIRLCREQGITPPFLLYDHYIVAASCYALEDLQRTEETCRKALAIDPDHLDSHYLLAALHWRREDANAALSAALRYLHLYGRYRKRGVRRTQTLGTIGYKRKIQQILGEIYYHLGEAEKGAAILTEAVKDSGGDPTCLREIALLYQSCGQLEQAERLYTEVLRTDPQDPEVLSALAVLRARTGSIDEAMDLFEQAAALEPGRESTLLRKGVLHLQRKEPADAEEIFRKVLVRNAEHPAAFTNLGLALEQQGREEEAEQAYERALTLKPDHPEALANLGHLRMRVGREEAAEPTFRRALATGLDGPDICLSLCRISLHRGNVDGLLEGLGRLLTDLEIPNPPVLETREALAVLFAQIAHRLELQGNPVSAQLARALAEELSAEAPRHDPSNMDTPLAPSRLLISLCMIVKDEAAVLRRCLQSVQGGVDEMVIVDTGSTDETVAIAQTFTATVLEHPWEGSFAKARNQALRHVTGQWVLQLDADEEMRREDALRLRELIGTLDDDVTHLYVRLINLDRQGSVLSQINLLRIFRYDGSPCYIGDVHNQIRIAGRGVYTDLTVYHYGYDLDPQRMAEKFERTVALLQKEVARDPENPNPHHSLCQSYANARMTEQAIVAGERTLELFARIPSDGDPRAAVYLNTCHLLCLAYLDAGDFVRARDICLEALQVDADNPDTLFGLAFACYRLGNYPGCIAHGEQALRRLKIVEEDPAQAGSVPVNTLGKQPMLELTVGYAYWEMNEPEKMLDYLEQGLARVGGATDFAEKISLFLQQKVIPAESSLTAPVAARAGSLLNH